ncbi:hypothetical protein R1sor_003782 [Riccia sorocarpa]|uniref:Uncharacterized protein n=1 Tax=Riccia sorocarpa TaxID=122646 RepID=A0ABD3H624_9MARC
MATEIPVASVPPTAQSPVKNNEMKKETVSPTTNASASAPAPAPSPSPSLALVPALQAVLYPQTPTTQQLSLAQQYLEYPAPLDTNEAVLSDEKLFYDTFYKLHEALKSRVNIPKMGGKDLNVHLLYKEVTSRGGLQQVIRDRKWKEITGAFEFPRTTTSASYVLRKYYINLLHHYEQVYKFGATGPLIPPPVALTGSSPSVTPGGTTPLGVHDGVRRRTRKRKMQMPPMPQVDPSEAVGTMCRGTLDGKLENGYLVTVVVGGEKVKGILYHIPPGPKVPTQFTNLPGLLASVSQDAAKTSVETSSRRKRRRKDEMPKKDPNAPRPNRTGYNFFFAEQRQRLKALHPDKDRDISRMIGEAWNSLSEEQKTPYQERGVKDKERFKKEMRDYREKMKSGFFDNAADPATGQAVTSPEVPSVSDQPGEEDQENALAITSSPLGEPTSEIPHQQTFQESLMDITVEPLNQQPPATLVLTQGEG